MSIKSLALSASSLVLVGALATAFIHPDAPSASHDLEESAHDLHEYMHDNFPSSYGAHGVEEAAGELHGTLHDWSNGSASECDVIGDRDDVIGAFLDMTSQFGQNGVFSDPNATAAYFDVFGNGFTVVLYTLFASC